MRPATICARVHSEPSARAEFLVRFVRRLRGGSVDGNRRFSFSANDRRSIHGLFRVNSAQVDGLWIGVQQTAGFSSGFFLVNGNIARRLYCRSVLVKILVFRDPRLNRIRYFLQVQLGSTTGVPAFCVRGSTAATCPMDPVESGASFSFATYGPPCIEWTERGVGAENPLRRCGLSSGASRACLRDGPCDRTSHVVQSREPRAAGHVPLCGTCPFWGAFCVLP